MMRLPIILLVTVTTTWQAEGFQDGPKLNLNLTRVMRTRPPQATTIPPEILAKAASLNISTTAYIGLKESLGGIELEERKQELEDIGEMVKIKKTPVKVNKLIKKTKKVNITETAPDKSLFQINQDSGLTPFLFQGDMNMNEAQLGDVKNSLSGRRKKRQISRSAPLWTANTLYYYFAENLPQNRILSVESAHALLTSQTCINFVKNSTAPNRVKVIDGSGCYSSVGMVGGEQTLSIGEGCQSLGTAAHEFSHSLGFFHTQMRSDRDDYVAIDLTDVAPISHINFMKYDGATSKNVIPYEYGSVMQYSADSFVTGNGKPSIVPLDTNFMYTMGGRVITFYDIYGINVHYECLCTTTSTVCKNGGYPNPRNCAVCNCPLGYGGDFCDELPQVGCGSHLNASATWQKMTINHGDETNWSAARNYYDFCIHWVSAPEGKKLELKVVSEYNTQCNYGCLYNGVELKVNLDRKMTNPRYCCAEFDSNVISSETNPTPVIAFNRYYTSIFVVHYRYVDLPTTSVKTTPTTTMTTTTTTIPLNPNCKDLTDSATCAKLYASQSSCASMSKAKQKLLCARTFGLCGKSVDPCADLFSGCPAYKESGYCTVVQPLIAEYNCAASCGFCAAPI